MSQLRTLRRRPATWSGQAPQRFLLPCHDSSLPERDLLRYYDRILQSITIPLLIQDFNPGGPTLSLSFLKQLRGQHQHFRFLKLEEPLMSTG